MGIVGSIVGGIIGSNAAKNAASVQQKGAQQAQTLEQKNQQDALDLQRSVWTGDQANQQPYLDVGSTSANHLRDLLQTPFSAPTLEDARATPGYQFTLEQGTNAINQNAAANGTLLTGNTGAALQRYGQGLADTTYNDVYNRALNTYMTHYNTLMGGVGVGQNATGQYGQQGQAAASNTANVDLTGGAQQAQQINNAAAARASGYIGSGNAWNQAINNAGNQFQDLAAGAMLG